MQPARLFTLFLFGAALASAQQLEIINAQYGAGFNWRDATRSLREKISGNRLILRVEPGNLGVTDPAPGVTKVLRVKYRWNGEDRAVEVADFDELRIPPDSPGFSLAELFPGAAVRPTQPGAASPAPAPSPTAAAPAPIPPAAAPRADRGWPPRSRRREARSNDLLIRHAHYGHGDRTADVQLAVQSMVAGGRANFVINGDSMKTDPAPGVVKTLRVHYEFRGRGWVAEGQDGQVFALPAASPQPWTPEAGAGDLEIPQSTAPPEGWTNGRPENLRIFSARYGGRTLVSDVRPQVEQAIREGRLPLRVGPDTLGGDPEPGSPKLLAVRYEYRGRTWERFVADGDILALP